MRKVFKNHPLEVVTGIAGVLVTALGVALSRNGDWSGVAGTLLSIVGASLAAVVSASIFGSQRANERFVALLTIIRNQLATSSSQISAALSGHLYRGESIDTTLSRVDQGVGSISSLLRDIGGLLGSEATTFDTEAIVESKREVLDLGQALDALKSRVAHGPPDGKILPSPQAPALVADIEEMQAKVSEVLASLARAEAPSPERRFLPERASCPGCGTAVSFELGSIIGDSQTPKCEHCRESFHAHRTSTGVLVNPLSGATRSPASILARHNMRLPSRGERQQYLRVIERAHRAGHIVTAHDLTNVVDVELAVQLPAAVRMPLFYALINREYGLVKLEVDETKQMRARAIVEFDAGDADEFVEHAEAAWLAQAVFRLWGYPVESAELSEFFFGSSTLGAQEAKLLERATGYAAVAIEKRESAASESVGYEDRSDDDGKV